jgi:hypothetical protein
LRNVSGYFVCISFTISSRGTTPTRAAQASNSRVSDCTIRIAWGRDRERHAVRARQRPVGRQLIGNRDRRDFRGVQRGQRREQQGDEECECGFH